MLREQTKAITKEDQPMPTKSTAPAVVTYKKADSEKALSTHKALATRTENEATKLVIADDPSYDKAVEKLAQVKTYIKDIEKQRKKITDPLNTAMKETNALFKPTREKLEKTRDLLAGGILDYRREQERIEAEKQAELEAKVESGEMDFDDALDATMDAPQLEKTQTTKWGNTTVRTIRDIEVVDLTQIPKEYFELNISRLRADVLGNKSAGIEGKEIPGVKIIERESV